MNILQTALMAIVLALLVAIADIATHIDRIDIMQAVLVDKIRAMENQQSNNGG